MSIAIFSININKLRADGRFYKPPDPSIKLKGDLIVGK